MSCDHGPIHQCSYCHTCYTCNHVRAYKWYPDSDDAGVWYWFTNDGRCWHRAWYDVIEHKPASQHIPNCVCIHCLTRQNLMELEAARQAAQITQATS